MRANAAMDDGQAAEPVGPLAPAPAPSGDADKAQARLQRATALLPAPWQSPLQRLARELLAVVGQGLWRLEIAVFDNLRSRQQLAQALSDIWPDAAQVMAGPDHADWLALEHALADAAGRAPAVRLLAMGSALDDPFQQAINKGYIADTLQARGQLDDALAMHEQRLPTFEALGDASGKAHVRYSMAGIQLARGDHHNGGLQATYDKLNETYQISLQTGQAEAIAAIGSRLAQVMVLGGQPDGCPQATASRVR